MFHALAKSVVGFSVARIFLGIGEAGHFPAAVKTVAEWFPKRNEVWLLVFLMQVLVWV